MSTTVETAPTGATFADLAEALDFARMALGQPPAEYRSPDARTRSLMDARAMTAERLGWRWTFTATSGPESFRTSIDFPPPVARAHPQ